MTTPRTAAGRALYGVLVGMTGARDGRSYAEQVAGIEAEARAAALDEARAAVEGLPAYEDHDETLGLDLYDPTGVRRADALAAIDALRERSGE